jgi:hypothetical protein
MKIRSIMAKLWRPRSGAGPVARLLLIFIPFWLVAECVFYLTGPRGDGHDPYGGFIVILTLLFNSLPSVFQWRRSVAVALWILAVGWLVFGFFYICYWSRVLYPIHMPGAN